MIENVIYCNCTITTLKKVLQNMFEEVKQINENEIVLFNQINLKLDNSTKQLKITTSNYKEDSNEDIASNICLETILNELVILIISLDSTESDNEKIALYNTEIDAITLLFKEQFGEQLQPIDKEENNNLITIVVGKNTAKIDIKDLTIVDCKSVPLRGRIDSILQIANKLNKNMP